MTPQQVSKVFEIPKIKSDDLQRIHEIVYRIKPVTICGKSSVNKEL